MRGSDGFALPYLTLSKSDAVNAGEWYWEGPPGTGVEGNLVRGWDSALAFTITRTIVVDLDRLRTALQIDGEAVVDCVVTCHTAGRKLRWIAFRHRVALNGPTQELAIAIDFDSSRLAETLLLTTGFFVGKTTQRKHQFSPERVGSRLWEDSFQLVLEGTSPRPCIRTHSFAHSYAGDGIERARHYVEICASDAQEPFASSVTVNLNTDVAGYVAAISAGASEPSRQLFEAIVRAVLMHVLSDKLLENVDRSSMQPGSIGDIALGWLDICFPDLPVGVLRKRCLEEPGRFEAQVNSGLASTLTAIF